MMTYFGEVDRILREALREDIGTGDITTQAIFTYGEKVVGNYIAKEEGVVCGVDIAKRVFDLLEGEVKFEAFKADGDTVFAGDVIARVSGDAVCILQGERVGLNLMQRMSGIATQTARAVKKVEGTRAKIIDTRKTAPGLRIFEKYAVGVGGGGNHRFNLSDGVLIKDNHIAACGSITEAVSRARKKTPHTVKIEVEVENLDQLREALECRVDIIMLDNMSDEMMAEAVRIVDGRAVCEASGNMSERDLLSVANTGVDLISIGALTHSVKALDISLKFQLIEDRRK